MSRLLEFKDVSLTVKDKIIINKVSLVVENKGISVITGSNGAGKTTLLRLMGGLITPTEGEITRHNHNPGSPIGFVFQNSILLRRTVRNNLYHALLCTQHSAGEQYNKIIDENLKKHSIYHLAEIPAHKLSIGEQQIISTIRALIISPCALFLDEPTSSLDPTYTKAVEKLIGEASKQIKVVLVTQNQDQVKMFGNNILHLSNGQLV